MTTPLPPIRACLFDVDGLLIDSEDIYTLITNTILRSFSRPDLPWSLKAQLQGRPAPDATRLFLAWANLPLTPDEYAARQRTLQSELFPRAQLLPGVHTLLKTLATAAPAHRPHDTIHLAIATSSSARNFRLKTDHLRDAFALIPEKQVVTGDDPRIAEGRGKPAPDIYLLALETINAGLRESGAEEVRPEECLVFEDAVPGVEAARRAGMRVVWVPHEGLLGEYKGREELVLAGLMGEAVGEGMGAVGSVGDGWGELRRSLEGFEYGRYGIVPRGEVREA